MRIESIALFLAGVRRSELSHWQRSVDNCPSAGLRLNAEDAPEPPHAFFHAKQAEAARRGGIEAAAVVLDRNDDIPDATFDGDLDGAGVSVFGYIVQRLLHDTVNAGLVFFGK
jgi:hypothetical protein